MTTNQEYVFLTKTMLLAGLSRNGAFSKAQVEALGVEFPKTGGWPKSGWKRKLIGTVVLKANYEKFLQLKDKHLEKKEQPVKTQEDKTEKAKRTTS